MNLCRTRPSMCFNIKFLFPIIIQWIAFFNFTDIFSFRYCEYFPIFSSDFCRWFRYLPTIGDYLKVTWYLWGKNSKNRQVLDILTCNSANLYIAKLQTKTSRSCIFSLFLPHKYQVSLIEISMMLKSAISWDDTYF